MPFDWIKLDESIAVSAVFPVPSKQTAAMSVSVSDGDSFAARAFSDARGQPDRR